MSVSRTVRRSTLILLLVLTALAARPESAGAANNDEMDYLNRINALRASVGVAPLAFDSNMNDLAREHNDVMVAQQNLFHTPQITAGVTVDWQKLGENVGTGSNTEVVFEAFVKSPHHYANIVDPAFTHIGIAVTTVGRLQWTTHRFVQIVPAKVFVPPPPPPSTFPPTTEAPAPPPVTAPPVIAPPVTVPRTIPRTVPTTIPPTVTTTTTSPPPPPSPLEPTPADAQRVDELLRVLRFSG